VLTVSRRFFDRLAQFKEAYQVRVKTGGHLGQQGTPRYHSC